MNSIDRFDARTIATLVRSGKLAAREVTEACLKRIERRDASLNCFTTVTRERALAEAARIDRAIQSGSDPGPLAGVPYAVKNLFDIAGTSTAAGSKIHRERAPADKDATLVTRMADAGAILVGALNMDEYAYGFTTENAHFGPTHNPHDASRICGGSSGGSAAAVAAEIVPISLGSDTNGSIRVPAAFCGVFGLKPTYGRLSRRGMFGFVGSLDHAGAFARSVSDLALAYDTLQDVQKLDAVTPAITEGLGGLRVGVLSGWFRLDGSSEALEAVDIVADFLQAVSIELPAADVARAAAFCITAAEGANQHFANLRTHAADFDPATRNRLLAGALLPAAITLQAQRFRTWFRDQVALRFRDYDVLIAPCTPFSAPPIGGGSIRVGRNAAFTRAHIGVYTQPISFIGLPVLAAPVCKAGKMPVGVQIIAAPWAECTAFRVAAALEAAGVAYAPIAPAVQNTRA